MTMLAQEGDGHLKSLIRRARPTDHEDIASLLQQLGYKTTSAQIFERLASIHDSLTDFVLLAIRDERIVGCISLHLLPLFHRDGFLGRITSLVIDKEYRGQHIGSELMDAATDWFSANGGVKMEVTSGDHRLDAHRFYEAQGLARDGQRFSKSIVSASIDEL